MLLTISISKKKYYMAIIILLSLFFINTSFAIDKNINVQPAINYSIIGDIDIIKSQFFLKYQSSTYHKNYDNSNILGKFFIFINTNNTIKKQEFFKKIFVIAKKNKNIQYILLDLQKNAKYNNIKINPASNFTMNFLQDNDIINYDENGWLNSISMTIEKDDDIIGVLKKEYNYETVAFNRVGNIAILEKNNIFYYIINDNWTDSLLLYYIINK